MQQKTTPYGNKARCPPATSFAASISVMVSLSTVAVFFLKLPPSLVPSPVFPSFQISGIRSHELHCTALPLYLVLFFLFTSPDINLPLAKLEHGSNYVFLSVFYVAVRHCFSIMDSLIRRRRTVRNGEGENDKGGRKAADYAESDTTSC